MKRVLCFLLICASLFLPAKAAQENTAGYLALTFDDGPSGRFTRRLLDGLAEREVKATFFLCGYRIEQYPELTARIAAEGHEIGTHGDTHRLFSDLSQQELCAELCATSQKIKQACGQEPTLLRPPGGVYDLKALEQTQCDKLPLILWSVDVGDWHRSDSEKIAADIVKKVKNGDVILMHDMFDSTVDATLAAIDILQANGYVFVTVSELARLSGTTLHGCEVYSRFSFEKYASISARFALTLPCAKPGFPPPRPFNSAFISRMEMAVPAIAY